MGTDVSSGLIFLKKPKNTTMRYHLTPIRMAIISKTGNKCWRGRGTRELSYTAGGSANWCSHNGKQYRDSSKNQEQNYHIIQLFCNFLINGISITSFSTSVGSVGLQVTHSISILLKCQQIYSPYFINSKTFFTQLYL